MNYENIILELKEKYAVITFNRPQAMNSLSIPLLRELEAALDELTLNQDILGLIITGNGKAFCAGADLTGNYVVSTAVNEIENQKDKIGWIHSVFNKLEAFQRPVIAAVNGYALGGGCEISLCCDIRIAGEKAIFGQPEVGLGVMACYGAPQRLPRLIGAAKAKELLYTNCKISAQEAYEIGLVNKVVPQDDLLAEAEAMMQQILKQAPIAVKFTKAAVNKGLEMPLSYALELELNMVAMLSETEDAKEGLAAFVEKRKPTFNNK